MNYELKDYLNAINQTKKKLLDDDQEAVKGYPPFCLGIYIIMRKQKTN